MKKFLYHASLALGVIIFALACFVVGSVFGVGQTADDLRKFWFDLFGLLGTWLSGIATLAAAYVALDIATRQRQDNVIDDKVRSLHHTMAIVNDLRGRVTYVKKMFDQGGGPLAALTGNTTALMRRYEALYDREIYTHLSGRIVDQITDMSGSFFGIETIVTITASRLRNLPEATVPATPMGTGSANPFEQLYQDLNNLYTSLEQERAALEM